MLPDVSHVLDSWLQDLTHRVISKSYPDADNFDPTFIFSDAAIKGVIQVAKPRDLQGITVDWSLRYIIVHTKSFINAGDVLIDRSVNYKVIETSNWSDAGYYRVIAEQIKGDYS